MWKRSRYCLYFGYRFQFLFFYQNGLIRKNVSPLGFILGDEGSGAVLGKKLIGDYLKNQLPKDLQYSFTQKYELSAAENFGQNLQTSFS